MAPPIAGTWRIVEMHLWDREAIDLLGPAFIEFNVDGTGRFRFVAVEGHLDCRQTERGPLPAVEFTWDGNDEGDHASGRGWANRTADGSLHGHIYFHLGDDSAFRAISAGKSS